MKPLINLSRATRLKVAQFWCDQLSAEWIVMALQTITSKHRDLRRISFHIPYHDTVGAPSTDIRKTVGETAYEQWLDLDRLLVQFWESHLIRPKITYSYGLEDGRKGGMDFVSRLLPEITKRGVVDLVKDR